MHKAASPAEHLSPHSHNNWTQNLPCGYKANTINNYITAFLPKASNTGGKGNNSISWVPQALHPIPGVTELGLLSAPSSSFTDISKAAQLGASRFKQGRRLSQGRIIHHHCLLQGYFDVQHLSLPAAFIQINGWYLYYGLCHRYIIHSCPMRLLCV